MTTIYLIRHAEAEGNLYRRIHGRYNSLVTDDGFKQIACLEERFRDIHIDAVYASGLYRTEATARAVYRAKGLPLNIEPGLVEVNMGCWEDIAWGEARHFDGERLTAFNRSDPAWGVEGSETLGEVGKRGADAVRRIAEANPGRTVALFSHGTIIRQTLAELEGIGPEGWPELGHSDNTAVSKLEYEDGKFRVVFENDASHLPDELSTLRRQAWWRKDPGVNAADVNLWFRPLDRERDGAAYLEARREAWTGSAPFDGARTAAGEVFAAIAGDELVGFVQTDGTKYAAEGAGYIPFCCILPGRRGQRLGVQLIGQAVHTFRPLGLDKLRACCPPDDVRSQGFFARYGFEKAGQTGGGMDILEKYIGYGR